MFLRILWVLALAGTSVLAPGVVAARELTLTEAVDRAIGGSPTLRAEHAAVVATERQAELSGLPLPLTVGGELENFAGTGRLGGVDGAETTLRLGRTFELGGKRAVRQALGATRIAEQQNIAARRRLDVATEAQRRFIEVMAMQARLDLGERELTLARETRDAVDHRVKRGASPDADLPLAEIAVLRAEVELANAVRELASARVALSVLWGEPTPSFERVAGFIDTLRDPPTFEALQQRAARGADVRQFELEADRIEAQAQMAEAARSPDIAGTLGVRRFKAINDQAIVLSFSMPVGLAPRSNLALAHSRAERESLDERRKAFDLDRHHELFSRYQELRHARHEFEVLRDRMIPAAERALALARRGYDEARYSFLQIAQARGVLYALQNDRITAATRYHRLLIDLERATAVAGEPAP